MIDGFLYIVSIDLFYFIIHTAASIFAGELSLGSDNIFCTLIKTASTDKMGLDLSSGVSYLLFFHQIYTNSLN